MNQILQFKGLYEPSSENTLPVYEETISTSPKKIYQIQFFISAIFAICCLLLFLFHLLQISKNAKKSDQLLSIYNVSTLYSNSNEYSAQLMSSETNTIPNESTRNSFCYWNSSNR